MQVSFDSAYSSVDLDIYEIRKSQHMIKFYSVLGNKVKSISKVLSVILFCSLMSFSSALAQKTFNGSTNNNWNVDANWTPSGVPIATDDVIIPDGANVILDLASTSIASLSFADGGSSPTSISLGLNALIVSGDITLGIPAADAGDQYLNVDDGTLTATNITLPNTGDDTFDTEVTIKDGTITVSGDIVMNDGDRNRVSSTGIGTINIGGIFTGGAFARGSSTVNYNGAGDQTVRNYSYHNLTVSNSGIKTMSNSFSVYGTLTVGALLDVANRQLRIRNNGTIEPETSYGPNAMIDLSGTGYIRMDANTEPEWAITYPVGANGDYTPFNLTSISGTDINGTLYIRLNTVRHPLTVGANNTLTKYWNIRESGLNITSASGDFIYSDNDAQAPINEINLTKVGWFDGSTWVDLSASSSINHGSNTFSFTNVAGLGNDWTIGEATGCFDGLPSGRYTVQDGAWQSASTWNGNTVLLDDGTEDITIFHSVTPGDSYTTANVNSLKVEEDGYLNVHRTNFTVIGDFDIDGDVRDSRTEGGALNVGGNLNIGVTGTYNAEYSNPVITGAVNIAGAFRANQTRTFSIGTDLNVLAGGTCNLESSQMTITGNVNVDGNINDSNTNGFLNVGGSVIVNSTGTFDLQNVTVDITGTTTVDGLLTDMDGDGSTVFNGLLTINASGTFSSNNYDFTYLGGLENNGTFTNSSNYIFDHDVTISGNSELQFTNDLYIADNVTLTNQNTGGLSVIDVIDGQGANATLINSGVINYNDYARIPMLTGLLDCSSFPNTFNYNSSNRQYIKAISYYNLNCANNDDKELQGTTTVLNSLGTFGTADFECNGNDLIISGTVAHASTGVFTTGANIVTYNGALDQSILPISYAGNLITEGSGIKSIQGATSVTGSVTVQGTSTLSLNSNTFTPANSVSVSNGATLNVGDNSTLELADAATLTNNGTLQIVGSAGNPATITTSGSGGYLINQSSAGAEIHANYAVFDATGGITISDGIVDATNNFSNTTFTNGTGQEYLKLSNLDPIGGLNNIQSTVFEAGPSYNVSRTAGTATVNFYQATGALAGENYDNDNGNPGTLIEWLDPTSVYYSTGNVSAGLTASWTRNPDGSGGNPSSLTDGTATLIVQDGHTVTLDNNGDLDINKLIVGEGTSGIFQIGGDATQKILIIKELLEVQSGAQLIPSSDGSPAHILRLYGNMVNNGTVDLRASFTSVVNTELYGNMEIQGSNTPSFNDITFAAGSSVLTGVALDIKRNVYLETGAVFNDGGLNHTITYNWINNGGTYTSSGSLEFIGTTSQIIQTGFPTTFNNVLFSSGGLNAIKESITATGNFDVTNGTRISAGDVVVTIDGNFNIEAGTEYIQAQNTTSFNGTNAQAITLAGTTAFNNIYFNNGGANKKTVTGNINASNLLRIYPGATVDGTGDHVINNGVRVDGTCEFSGIITMRGGYLQSNNATPAVFTLGTAQLNIEGAVTLRHTSGGVNQLAVTVMEDVLIQNGGYLVLGEGAELIGQATKQLSIAPGRSLYIRGADNFPGGFGTYNFDPTAWVRYDGGIDQVIRGGFTYGQLQLSSNTKTADGPITITGELELRNSVVFNLGGFNHMFSGTRIDNGTGANGTIDGVGSTLTIGGTDANQTIEASGSGYYLFENLIVEQSAATQTRTKTFDSGVDLRINNDFTIQNTGGTAAIGLIVRMNDVNINNSTANSANDFSLGAYCELQTTNEYFGANVIDAFTNTKTFDLNSTVYYNLNGEQYLADGISYGNVKLYAGDKRAEGNLVIKGNFLQNGSNAYVFYDGGFMHTISGDWLLNRAAGYDAVSATGTIIFDGVDQDIDGDNFYNIEIANSGSANLYRSLVIYNDLTVRNGSTFVPATLNMTIGGGFTVEEGGVYTQSTGTTTFNGLADQTINVSSASTIGNFIINKPNPGGHTLTVASTNAELHINGNTDIYSQAGILDVTNQTVYLGGRFYVYDFPATTNFISTGSKLIFNGSSNQRVRTYHDQRLLFNDVEFSGTGGAIFDYSNPNPELALNEYEFLGDFEINGSVVNAYNINLYVQGDWINNGTFQHARTVYFDGVDQDISSSSFNIVNFRGAVAGTKTLSGGLTVNYDLTIDEAATLSAGINNISVGRTWRNESASGVFNPGTGKVVFDASHTARFYTGTTTGSQAGKIFNAIDINKSGTITLDGDLIVANDFNINSGTFSTSDKDLWVGGDFVNASTYSVGTGSALTLNASGGTHIFNPGGAIVRELIINAPAAVYEQQGDFTIRTVDMQINAGELKMNDNKIRINDNGRSININGGILRMAAGAELEFSYTQSLNMSSGELHMVGVDGNEAKLVNVDGSRLFSVNVTGGTVYAQYYRIQQGNLTIGAGASLDATNNLSNATYTNGSGSGAYLTLTDLDLGAGLAVNNVIFQAGPAINISRTSGNGTITVQDASGGLAGELYEEDNGSPGTLIDWTFPAGFFWDGEAANGLWHSAANWSGNTVPGTDDIVYLDHQYVAGPYAISIDGNADCNRLNLNGTGLSVTVESIRTLNVAQHVNIGVGNTLTQADNTTMINVGQNWTNLGTYNHGNSTLTFNGTGGSFNFYSGGTGAGKTFYDLVINADASVYALDLPILVENDLTISKGTLDLASQNNDIIVQGDWLLDQANGGVFIPSSADVTFNGVDQSITNGTFYNLIINGSGTTSLNSNIAVDHDVTLQASSIFDAQFYNLFVREDWVNNGGTFTQTGLGTVVFDGTATQLIENGTASTTFNNLTFSNGGGKFLNGDILVNSDVLINNTSGTVNLRDNTITGVGASNTFTNNRYMQIEGADNFPSTFETLNLPASSRVYYFSDIDQNIYPTTYGTVYLRRLTDGMSTKTATGDFAVLGSLNIDQATRNITLDMATNDANLSLTGNLGFVAGNVIDWGTGNSTLEHVGGGWNIDADIPNFNNLILSGTGDKYTYGDLLITGDLTVKTGIDLMLYANNRDNFRILTGAAGGTMTMETGARTLVTRPASSGVAFPEGFGTYDFNANSTFQLNSNNNVPQTVYTGGGITYGNLTFSYTKLVESDGTATLDVDGNFDMGSCTYNDNGQNMAVAGANVYITRYTPTDPSITLTLDGQRDQRVDDDVDNTLDLPTVVCSGSGVKTIGWGNEPVTISGNMIINSGLTATSARNITFTGANWLNSGIYTQTGGSLTFSGAQDQVIDAGASDPLNYFRDLYFTGAFNRTFVIEGADINGSISITDATVDLGTYDYTISGHINNVSGGTLLSANANITLDGGTQDIYSTDFSANDIFMTGSGDKRMRSNWMVGRHLEIDAGVRLHARPSSTSWNINLGGNWTNNGTFLDYTSTVTFDGTIPVILVQSGGSDFYNVEFSPASTVEYRLMSASTRFANVMNVNTDANLNLNGQTLYIGRNGASERIHTVDGTLSINADAFLYVNNDAQSTINVNGRLNVVGSSTSNVASLSSETTSTNRNKTLINVTAGATFAARYYLIEYIADSGINLMENSLIDPVNNLSDGTWMNLRDQNGARYLTLESDYNGTINNISFNYSGVPTQGRHYNVQRKLASDAITFANVTGAIGSFRFEDDVNPPSDVDGLLRWPPITESYWTGALDQDWHKDGNWDNGVPSATIDAIIPDVSAGSGNSPIIFTSDADIRNLNITDGLLELESNRNIVTAGDVSISDGFLAVKNAASKITVGGDWLIGTQGNFDHGDGTVEFNSANGSISIVPGSSNFYNLSINNALSSFETVGSTLNIEGDLQILNGVFAPATNNYTINLYGDYTITNGSYNTSNASGGTIELLAAGNQSISEGVFPNMIVGGTGDKLFSGNVEVKGNTTINSALRAQAGSTIVFEGNMQINASGTFDDGGETHEFKGVNWYGDGAYEGNGTISFTRTSSDQNVYASTFNNVDVNCSTERFILQENVTVNGDLIIRTGIDRVDLQTNTITGAGTMTAESGVNIYVYGNDNFPKGFASYDLATTSTTRYEGSSDQLIEGVSYGNLTLVNANTKTLNGDTEVKRQLTFNAATLDVSASNYSLTVGAYWENRSTGTFICRSGEVIFNGSANQYIRFEGGNLNEFYDLTVSGSASVIANNNTSNDFIVKNNLNVTSGFFHAAGRTIYVGGDFLATASGRFTNDQGTIYLNRASGTANVGLNGSRLLNLTINSGAFYSMQDEINLIGSFNLLSGTFNGNGQTVNMGNGSGDAINIEDLYIVGPSGVLGIGNTTTLNVSATGRLEVVGNGTGIARVTNNSSGGRYNFTVDGEIAAQNYLFEYMSNTGIYLSPSSTIDATYHFSEGTFSNGTTTGPLFRIENTQSFTGASRIENVSFPNNPGGSSNNVAKYSAVSGDLEFYNATGVFAGETFDNDPNNLITWTGPVQLTWNGSVGSDWNNANNWTPSSGGPIVPSSANNVIIASGGSIVNFPILTISGQETGNLTVNSGASILLNTDADAGAVDLDVQGDFIINGALSSTTVDDYISVTGNWTNTGTVDMKGNVTFNGTGGAKVINNNNYDFYSITIAGTSQYQLGRNTTVNNNVVIASGATFDVGPADYTLTILGDFTNAGSFNAQAGTVKFISSSGPVSISSGGSPFYRMEADGVGVSFNMLDDIWAQRELKITNGTFDLGVNTLRIGNGITGDNVLVSGLLKVNAGATLDMGNNSKLDVNPGGEIELLGTDDANRATLTSSTSGRYSFDVNSGASIKAGFYQVEYTDADGLYMHPGANIDATYNLSDGIFSNGFPGSGSYMTLLHEMGASETLRNLVFNAGPSYNVTRTSGTTIFHFEDASGDLGSYLNEKDEEAVPSPSSGLLRWPFVQLYTWEGDTDSDWFTASNWFNDQLPVLTSDVTIPSTANDPVIDDRTEVSIHGITIEAGATLTLQSGSRAVIEGDISTSDGLILENTDVKPSSFIHNGVMTGNTQVKWTYPMRRYWYVGHSITGVTMAEYDVAYTSPNDYVMYRYTSDWVSIGKTAYTFSDPLEGYSLNTKDGGEVTTTGVLNNGNYTRGINNGWSLMANPYPSYIDISNTGEWDLASADQSIYINTDISPGVRGFTTYNILTGLSSPSSPDAKFIAPGQSFWVRGRVDAETFRLYNGARTNSTSSVLKVAGSEPDVIRLTLNNKNASDELVIALRNYGGESISKYDSHKKLSRNKNLAEIYSIKDDSPVVIDVRSNVSEQLSIPVGIVVGENATEELSVEVANIDQFIPQTDIMLEDKVTGELHDLRSLNKVNFTSSATTGVERFVLHINSVTTGDHEQLAKDLYGISTLIREKSILEIDCKLRSNQERMVRVFALSGELITKDSFLGDFYTKPLPFKTGVYLVQVICGNERYEKKVVISQ